jgi:hypothetical protein
MIRDCSSCHSMAFAQGSGGQPRLLPHGDAAKVIATLRSFYGEGAMSAADAARKPPGFLARLTMVFSGQPRPVESAAVAGKIRALFAPRGLCSECHTTVAPSDPSSLDYRVRPVNQTDRFLPWGAFDHSVPEHRRDAAGQPTCESCHKAPDSDSATDVLLPRVAGCSSCHGKAKTAIATAASGDCAECHSFHAPGMATPKSDHGAPPAAAVAASSMPPRKRTLAAVDPGRREF